MKSKYLLSIIIPTKNRQEFALSTITQAIVTTNENVQIVVQDNSDNKTLEDMLGDIKKEKRLKYGYTNETLSFVDNFNQAVELADGEYVCIIGDDDGVLPNIIDVVSWASQNDIQAIKPSLDVVYYWPNSNALSENSIDDGVLVVNKIANDKIKKVKPINEIKKLLRNGCQDYLALDMVKLYHGIVKKDCLERVKNENGKYFKGLSPDIYISVALSLTIDEFFVLDFPVTISGICNKSGSSDSATGKHTGQLEDAPHFIGQKNYTWSEQVPRFYSVETIWGDSALAAITDLKKYDLNKKFNVSFISIYCYLKYPAFRDVIKENYEKNKNKKFVFLKDLFVSGYFNFILKKYYFAFVRKFKKIGVKKFEKHSIESISLVNYVILSNKLLKPFSSDRDY